MEQQYEYSKLLSYIDYEKLNKLVTNTHTLPRGVNNEILKIIDIIKLDENIYNNYVNELEDYLSELHDVYYFALDRVIKEIKKIRKDYIKCFDDQEYVMYNKVFDVYYDKRLKIYNKKINAGKLGTKKCVVTDKFKQPEKYNLTIGQEFESVGSLSQYTNKSRKTIAQWNKKGWIE